MQELCNYTNYPASENVKCYHSADQRQDVLEKKNLKHLALHDDHAASNLLTFGLLFSQGSLRHIYFHATFSWQFDCLFICWESVDFKTLN